MAKKSAATVSNMMSDTRDSIMSTSIHGADFTTPAAHSPAEDDGDAPAASNAIRSTRKVTSAPLEGLASPRTALAGGGREQQPVAKKVTLRAMSNETFTYRMRRGNDQRAFDRIVTDAKNIYRRGGVTPEEAIAELHLGKSSDDPDYKELVKILQTYPI
jgi:hypothetical protein